MGPTEIYDDCCVVFKGNAGLQFSYVYMIYETLPPVRCWLKLGSSPLPKCHLVITGTEWINILSMFIFSNLGQKTVFDGLNLPGIRWTLEARLRGDTDN